MLSCNIFSYTNHWTRWYINLSTSVMKLCSSIQRKSHNCLFITGSCHTDIFYTASWLIKQSTRWPFSFSARIFLMNPKNKFGNDALCTSSWLHDLIPHQNSTKADLRPSSYPLIINHHQLGFHCKQPISPSIQELLSLVKFYFQCKFQSTNQDKILYMWQINDCLHNIVLPKLDPV